MLEWGFHAPPSKRSQEVALLGGPGTVHGPTLRFSLTLSSFFFFFFFLNQQFITRGSIAVRGWSYKQKQLYNYDYLSPFLLQNPCSEKPLGGQSRLRPERRKGKRFVGRRSASRKP